MLQAFEILELYLELIAGGRCTRTRFARCSACSVRRQHGSACRRRRCPPPAPPLAPTLPLLSLAAVRADLLAKSREIPNDMVEVGTNCVGHSLQAAAGEACSSRSCSSGSSGRRRGRGKHGFPRAPRQPCAGSEQPLSSRRRRLRAPLPPGCRRCAA